MNYDYILDSILNLNEVKFDFEGDKMSVLFENEGVVLTADKDGNYAIESKDGTAVSSGKAQSDRRFMFIYCSIKDNAISVRFPVTETVDHYPNCDGEYDRYSTKIIDNIIVTCEV